MSGLLEPQLIQQYLDGDEKALEEIISRWIKPIYSFVYRYVGNAQDAEDIAQEVFFKAWRNIRKYKQDMTFSTWLFTIARNTAIDWLRKKRPASFAEFEDEEGENPVLDGLVDPEPLPDEVVAKLEENKQMSDLLNQLSPKYREVVVMHYYDHLTFDEIANILKKPLNTVKSHHRRAILALKKLLDAPNFVSHP